MDRLRLGLAVTFAATLILTWKLWMSDRTYPLAPFFDWLAGLPVWLDYLLLGVMMAALAAAAFVRDPRWPIRIVLGVILLLAILDQNRWQPYIIHFALLLGTLLLLPWERRERWTDDDLEWGLAPARLLLAFTYLFSGLQKLNISYMTDIFPWLLEPGLQWFGAGTEAVAEGPMYLLAFLSAAGEGLGGLLLLFRPTRRIAAIFLIAMHTLILLVLGPLGRSSNTAVWPWNLAMIVSLWALFLERSSQGYRSGPSLLSRRWFAALGGRSHGSGSAAVPRKQRAAIIAVLLLFGIAPVFSFWNLWDSYLSFSFYSGNLHEARVQVDSLDHPTLPPQAQALIDSDGGFNPLFWAVDEMNATPYPEPRVMLQLGQALARRARMGDVYIQIADKPDILTAERRIRTYRCPRGGGDPEEIFVR